MRRFIQWTFVPVAVVALAACGKRDAQTKTAMNPDLQRDLKLASASPTLQINPDEIAPKSHQDLAVRPKEAPKGPRVIPSEHHTVKAPAKATKVAAIKTEIPQVQVMASAPAPSETPAPDSPPLARPSPVPAQTYPSTERIPDNGAGSGSGVLGGIIGAVIRGGMIGDDDHCDPRGPHRGGGRAIGGDIIGGIMGGMAGGRFPRGRP